jgi:hypothetical protein
MNDSKLEELLFTYVKLILKCEGYLKYKYDLKDIPYKSREKIPQSGQFELEGTQLRFYIHGLSCKFSLGAITIDYDIYLDRKNYIATSPWKLSQFVNSYSKLEEEFTEIQIANFLAKLKDRGVISKILPDYLVYEINFDWYKWQCSD